MSLPASPVIPTAASEGQSPAATLYRSFSCDALPPRQSTEDSLSGLCDTASSSAAGSPITCDAATFVVGAYRVTYCPICFEVFTQENPAMVFPCGHVFHTQCHYAWRERSAVCAVCQVVVSDADIRMMRVGDIQSVRRPPRGASAPKKSCQVVPAAPVFAAVAQDMPPPAQPQPLPTPISSAQRRRSVELETSTSRCGILASLKRAFSCFRTQPRGNTADSASPRRHGSIPLTSRIVTPHPSTSRETQSAAPPSSAALAYEQEEARMMQQKSSSVPS